MSERHRLLDRQLRRHGLDPSVAPPVWEAFLRSVDTAYGDFDKDRELIERSMEISSQELLHANAEMQALLQGIPDLFLRIDEKGRIVAVHPGDGRGLQLPDQPLLGKPLTSLQGWGIVHRFEQALAEVRREKAPATFEYEIGAEDRRKVYEARLIPLDGGHALILVRNITDTRRVDLAEAASRAKSVFLANMSHELRTPLHGILSYASFGLRSAKAGKPEQVEKYFSIIQDCGKTLLGLLDDLLDLAKLEAGRVAFEFEEADLGQVAERVCDEYNSRASEAGVRILLRESDDPCWIVCDARRITQVLRNLLANAVKYSPRGSEVEVSIRPTEDSVRVAIEDQGPGIPKDELESIFEKFVQSSRTGSGAGGTGLGLAISREIVSAHRGRITAENRVGGGARLVFEIPRTISPGHVDVPLKVA